MNPIQQIVVTVIAIAILVGGGSLFYRMVGYMGDMSGMMQQMSGNISNISKDISAMKQEFQLMRGEVTGIQQSVKSMDQSFSVGTRQMEQINPMQIISPFSGKN